ncbi:MAG TPA: hypothetical protein VIK39_12115, partial [Candidatus Angelobacter sp.]
VPPALAGGLGWLLAWGTIPIAIDYIINGQVADLPQVDCWSHSLGAGCTEFIQNLLSSASQISCL